MSTETCASTKYNVYSNISPDVPFHRRIVRFIKADGDSLGSYIVLLSPFFKNRPSRTAFPISE